MHIIEINRQWMHHRKRNPKLQLAQLSHYDLRATIDKVRVCVCVINERDTFLESSKKVWTMTTNENDDDELIDEELIDEESILTAEDYVKPMTNVIKGVCRVIYQKMTFV